jgi:hypothetical protein
VDDQRRMTACGDDTGAHLFEWFDNPLHGAPRQRGVPDQCRDEGLTGQYSNEHSHGGAGISSIEGSTRRTETVQSSSEYRDGAVGVGRGFDSQMVQAGQRGLTVGARGIPGQPRRAVCKRREQRVSV